MSVNEVKFKKAVEALSIKGTGSAASRTFCIGNEDHTLGNSLRHVLMQSSPDVNFAGYSVPHPSEPFVHVRVQTSQNTTAGAAVQKACHTLAGQCDIVLEKLEAILPEAREDRIELDRILAEEGYDDEDEEEGDAMEEG